MQLKTIFLDLDGALTDSREGIERCMQYALEKLGAPAVSPKRLTRTIGAPLHASFAELLGQPGENVIVEAVRLYRERFDAKGIFENRLFPGVVELLRHIQESGWRVCLVTSKPSVYARRIIDHFSLRGYFAEVYGSNLDGTLAHKGELIRCALTQEALAPERVIMIGDRSHDIAGACANGVAAIGVTYGYGGREELEQAGARWICDDAASVFEVLCAATEGAAQ